MDNIGHRGKGEKKITVWPFPGKGKPRREKVKNKREHEGIHLSEGISFLWEHGRNFVEK